jgi:hypothetical protein
MAVIEPSMVAGMFFLTPTRTDSSDKGQEA